MNIPAILHALSQRQELSHEQMTQVMRSMLNGEWSATQLAALLMGLRCKGETVTEITAAAQVMRELVVPVKVNGKHLLDTCGTGGDGVNTFNISTTVAFVVAAAGGQVAKHGSRSVSSCCGSADVLEAAGVNLHLTVEQVSDSVEQLGIGFLFAPHHHPAMQYIAPVRKELAIRTLFNLLGPLVNPASAPNQLLGVFSSQWLLPLAQVLQNLGSEHVMVVHAQDGLDEISLACETDIAELKQGNIEQYRVCPEQFGFQRQSLSGLAIQNVSESLAIMQSVLANQPSAALDIVLLNAGAAIYTANLTESLVLGIEQARAAIATGAAMAKLQALIEWSQDQSLSV